MEGDSSRVEETRGNSERAKKQRGPDGVIKNMAEVSKFSWTNEMQSEENIPTSRLVDLNNGRAQVDCWHTKNKEKINSLNMKHDYLRYGGKQSENNFTNSRIGVSTEGGAQVEWRGTVKNITNCMLGGFPAGGTSVLKENIICSEEGGSTSVLGLNSKPSGTGPKFLKKKCVVFAGGFKSTLRGFNRNLPRRHNEGDLTNSKGVLGKSMPSTTVQNFPKKFGQGQR